VTLWSPEWRVTIDGTQYEGLIVANVSITSGRSDINVQPVAGYCSMEILQLTNETFTFGINSGLTVELKNSAGTFVPIFGGNITDVAQQLRNAGSTTYVTSTSITALGALARLPKALTEGVLTKDLDGVQIASVLSDLLLNNWNEVPPALTWADYPATTTWANAENAGLGTIDAGDYELANRSSNETDMYSLVAALATSGLGYLYEDPQGRINYAGATHRQDYLTANGYTVLSANQAIAAGLRTVTQAQNVRNVISVKWKSGTESATDATSVATYGKLSQSVQTTLEHQADAASQASRYLSLRAYPRAMFGAVTYPLSSPEIDDSDRDALINIFMGQPIHIDDLPSNMGSVFEGFVEGWTWSVTYGNATLTINASPTEFSLVTLRWNQVSASEAWNTLSNTLTWEEATGVVS
jgi:hypothetical protein